MPPQSLSVMDVQDNSSSTQCVNQDEQRDLLEREHGDEDEIPGTPPTPPLEQNDTSSIFFNGELEKYTIPSAFYGELEKYTSPSAFYGELEKSQWKDTHWIQNQYDELKNAIPKITFSPAELGVTKGKIVLFGPVGHGKSSFINSVISIAKGRIEKVAPDGASEESMILEYNKFVCDNLLVTEIMGIEAWDEHGFNMGDITYLLKGNIKNDYKFDQANPITPTSPDFRQNPSTADRVHCVILCLNTPELADILTGYMKKIQALNVATNELGIPRIMILTNIDNVCAFLNEDLRNTFKSSLMQNLVYRASKRFEIPKKYIHPVQNFTREIYPEPMQSILLLTALKQALDLANVSLNTRRKLIHAE